MQYAYIFHAKMSTFFMKVSHCKGTLTPPPSPALLSEVIEMTPQVALDSLPRLREAFSYLSVLPPSSATDLLEAVLVRFNLASSLLHSFTLPSCNIYKSKSCRRNAVRFPFSSKLSPYYTYATFP